jgi:hypothetical protein
MRTENINGHLVEIPVDMLASLGGMFDSIMYRGIEINNFENGIVQDGIYHGPFMFDVGNGDIEVPTLNAARNIIDEALGK